MMVSRTASNPRGTLLCAVVRDGAVQPRIGVDTGRTYNVKRNVTLGHHITPHHTTRR